MDEIKLKAMAKINLGLDVLKKREDGYHEVRMIMQNVNLYDAVFIKKISENAIKVSTNLYYLPTNENNLVYKAAKLLKEEFNLCEGIEIDLKKHIPVAAGMAGGSADAATVLYGMNRLFKLGLSKADLMKRGVKIGADVPYCILRGTALSEGIGEILTPLPSMPKCHILIAKPGISLSTKYVYENLHANELKQHPDIDGIIEAIKEKNVKKVAAKLENVLETVSIKQHPVIAEIKEFMKNNGALNAIMSGSGPTVFGVYDDLSLAEQAYQKLKDKNIAKQIFLTETFNNTEES